MSTAVPERPSFLYRPYTSAARGLTLHVATGAAGREVRAEGRLVAGAGATHPLWTALARELGRDLVLDLSGITAIDAAGVGRLLHTRERLAGRGARLTIIRASTRVRHVLDLAGLSPALCAPGDTRTGGHAPAPRPGEPAPAAEPEPEPALCGCGH